MMFSMPVSSTRVTPGGQKVLQCRLLALGLLRRFSMLLSSTGMTEGWKRPKRMMISMLMSDLIALVLPTGLLLLHLNIRQ
ncbi:hypothetical protein PGIGA_G00163840 [Pangasianodon gigas]|uniref:Uncharacterized protein n=1 Tax=Pangasianodon gigas TaxID=30993 RepID=A0ACC5XRX5_PANGG|nr:hypothetical protein [Pangasianodon gigas]